MYLYVHISYKETIPFCKIIIPIDISHDDLSILLCNHLYFFNKTRKVENIKCTPRFMSEVALNIIIRINTYRFNKNRSAIFLKKNSLTYGKTKRLFSYQIAEVPNRNFTYV